MPSGTGFTKLSLPSCQAFPRGRSALRISSLDNLPLLSKTKTASVRDKALKQVASAISNSRDYAQAVIDTLSKEKAA